MSREIKFRAWDDNKLFPIAMAGKPANPSVLISSGWVECTDRVVLMQFTGERDKNGKDVYEGDIVQYDVDTEYGKEKMKDEVTFAAGAFYPTCLMPSSEFEIIGNIYENPQLLSTTDDNQQ